MRYLDVDLEIGPGHNGVYPVAVRLPAGAVRGTLRFPFEKQTLELYLSKLENARLRSRAGRRQLLQPQEEEIRAFGAALFDALIAGEVRTLYDQQHARARQQGMGVRMRLLVEAPDLATLPWEYLLDQREADFLCLSPKTPLVRYVKLPQPLEPLQVQPPLRILAMAASPSNLDQLDVEGERTRMGAALSPLEDQGLVKLRWVPGQTWQDLQEALWRGPWHIFHFIGHGAFNPHTDEGILALADPQGQAHLLPGSHLGRLLANGSLRLVVLNACEGAKGSERDLFSSAGASLVRREIPAVVAMQAEISDGAALEFTRTFYRALAAGIPVDAALAEARTAIWISIPHTLEWGTPVLYLRSPDGVLFDVALTKPSGSIVQPAAPGSAPQREPVTPRPPKENWLKEGMQHHAAGRYQQALDCYTKASQGDPTDARPSIGKGDALWQLGRHQEALAAFAHAIQLAPNDGAAYRGQGDALSALGRHQEALAAYERALRLAPEDAEARRGRDAARQALQAQARPAKTTPQWVEEGEQHRAAGRDHAALDCYEHALRLDQGNAQAMRGKSLALFNLKQPEEALKAAEEAIRLDPSDATAHYTKGSFLSSLQRHQEALPAFEAAITRNPHFARFYAAKGQALAALGRDAEAFQALQEGLAMAPDDSVGRGALDDLTRRLPVGTLLLTLTGHTDHVYAVAWSPDGRRLASGSKDQTVRLWDAATGKSLATLTGHTGSVSLVAWSPDGRRLASARGSFDGPGEDTVRLWDAATGKLLATLTGHTSSLSAVAWSPDSGRLASASADGTVRLWDAVSGAHLATLKGHKAFVEAVAWSPDGRRLASASGSSVGTGENTVRLWDAATGQCLATLKGHKSGVQVVAWSPDSRRLASASGHTGDGEHTVRLWDAATGKPLLTLTGHTSGVNAVAWSPDGRRLASASGDVHGGDPTVRLWDVATGKCLATLIGHTSSVEAVAWSPDGHQLASGSWDRTARLWDATTGAPLATLTGHKAFVDKVAWSPDGRRLASRSMESLRVWWVGEG